MIAHTSLHPGLDLTRPFLAGRQPNESGLVIGAADRPSGQTFFSESEWAAQKLIDLAELGR
jgi:hypothetical protein